MVTMLTGVFAMSSLLCFYLLSIMLHNKRHPILLPIIHGGIVVLALSMVIRYATNTGPANTEGLVLFLLAAFGGVLLIYKDIHEQQAPRWLVISHSLISTLGMLFLVLSSLNLF